MGFFDEVDSIGIVEDHVKQVLGLETSESERLIEAYQTVRRELSDRLSRMPPGTFTAQHLRGVLAQVQGAIEAMNAQMGGMMSKSSFKAAMMGVDHLTKEIRVFDEKFTGAVTPINLNAALLATDTSNFLVTKYKTNLDAYGSGLMAQISNGLFQASIGEANVSEVIGNIGQFFTAEQWKLARIARTEMHNIYSMGKLKGMGQLVDDTIPDLMKSMMHPLDARTAPDSKELARENPVLPIDEPFVFKWAGKTLIFMAPPNRPNDRAILVPYRKAWGTEGDVASFIPGRYPAP